MKRQLGGLVCLLAALCQGCTSVAAGRVIGSQRIAGSERRGVERDRITVVSRPTLESPTLVVRAVREAEQSFEVRDTHEAIKVASPVKDVFATIFWTAAATATFGAAESETVGDQRTEKGKDLVAVGVVSAILAFGFLTHIWGHPDPEVISGQKIEGDSHRGRETVVSSVISGERLSVSVDGTSRTYTTGSDGDASIDIRDFGVRVLVEPRVLRLRVSAARPALSLDEVLDSRTFTEECVKTSGRGSVYQAAFGSGGAVGEFAPNQIYVVREKNGDWVAVDYHGRSAWLPAVATTACWTTR